MRFSFDLLIYGAAAIVGLAFVAAVLRRPWLGVAAMLVLTPLKTMPGNHGILTAAKGCGALALAVILVRSLMGRAKFHLTHGEMALALVILLLLLALRGTPDPEYEWVYVLSYVSLWLMILIVQNGANGAREYSFLGWAFMLMLILPTLTSLSQGVLGYEPFGPPDTRWGHRLHGTYNGPNGMAVLLSIGVTYVLGFLVSYYRHLPGIGRLAALLLWGGMLWAAQETYSRSVPLAILCGGAYVVLRYHRPALRVWPSAGGRFAAVLGFCILITAAGLYIGSSKNWQTRWGQLEGLIGDQDVEVNQPRINDFKFVYDRALSDPELVWLGVGLGNYRELVGRAKTSEFLLSGTPHNIVLHFFVMGGLLGLCALTLVVLAVWRHGGYEASHAERAPPAVRAHWFASWACAYACIPLLMFQGGAMANEIWLVVAMAILGKRIAQTGGAAAP